VLPGFIETEGFPAAELRANPMTRWMVSTPEKAARAIRDAGVKRRPERYVPRGYAAVAAMRVLAPWLLRRGLRGSAGTAFTTKTGADAADARARSTGAAS
jgi:hypothetical protein